MNCIISENSFEINLLIEKFFKNQTDKINDMNKKYKNAKYDENE